MTDYSKFDAALLAEIRTNPQDFASLIRTRSLTGLAQSLDALDRFGHPAATGRIFDRRLQALRRAGRIRYSRGKWEAISD